jgi:hypothetical protein
VELCGPESLYKTTIGNSQSLEEYPPSVGGILLGGKWSGEVIDESKGAAFFADSFGVGADEFKVVKMDLTGENIAEPESSSKPFDRQVGRSADHEPDVPSFG